MLSQLFIMECKSYIRNRIYWLFALILLIFYFSQLSPFNTNRSFEPQKDDPQTYYSYEMYKQKDIVNKIYINLMRVKSMGSVYKTGVIVTKTENLSESQRKYMDTKVSEVNEVLVKLREGTLSDREALEQIINIAENVDKTLGGSTIFAPKNRSMLLTSRDSYEESMRIWNEILKYDHFTDSPARSLADGMGIITGFLPIFLAAFMMKREKKNQMEEVIYSRNFADWKYILAKWMALFSVIAVIFFVITIHATILFYIISNKHGYPFQIFSFFKYILFWVFPTLAFVISLGLFISVLTEKRLLAVFIQLILWFLSILPLSGDYRFHKIFIRFNGVSGYNEYIKWFTDILANRVFYILLSVFLIAISTFIFSKKRSFINEGNKYLFSSSKI